MGPSFDGSKVSKKCENSCILFTTDSGHDTDVSLFISSDPYFVVSRCEDVLFIHIFLSVSCTNQAIKSLLGAV